MVLTYSRVANMENQNTVNQPIRPQSNEAERDIFTDPALAEQTRDPIAEFLKQQWKPVLFIVVLAFSAIYIRDTLRASHQVSLEASANSFFKAQEALEDYKKAKKALVELESKPLPTEKDKQLEEEKLRTEAKAELALRDDRLKQSALVLSDALEPYKKLSALINTLAAKERGDVANLKSLASQYSVEAVMKVKGADRMVAELSSLAVARALLDSSDGEKQGIEMLKALAEQGETVEISAALTLARLASSEDEKKQAQQLLKTLAEKNPEQAALLKNEIQ
jgi:hypothetical protein